MSDQAKAIGAFVLFVALLFGTLAGINVIDNQRDLYIEDHKWVIGETRSGVTLTEINDGWGWSRITVFSCDGETYSLKSGDVRQFPGGLVIRLLMSYPSYGYVTVEES